MNRFPNILLLRFVIFVGMSSSCIAAAETSEAINCSRYPMLVKIERSEIAIKKIRIEEGPKYVLLDAEGSELASLNCKAGKNGKEKAEIKTQSRLKPHEISVLRVASVLQFGYDMRDELGINDYYLAKETPIRTYITSYGSDNTDDYSPSLRISDRLLGAKGSIKLNCFPKPVILYREANSITDTHAVKLYTLPDSKDCKSKVLESIQWSRPAKAVFADPAVLQQAGRRPQIIPARGATK